MAHTPGPWNIWDEERELNPEMSTGFPLIVAPVSSTGQDETVDICEVNADIDEYVLNAHLIAAAPDLLAALELFMDQYHIPGDRDRESRPEIKAALAAISKAKGE